MAKQLRNTESGTRGIRRILRQQTAQALEALHRDQQLSDEVVHEVRKQLKKVRAALRLLRKALGSRTYDRENAVFRNAARPFTEEVGADPGRLRIAYTARTPDGELGHPDCVAAVEHAARPVRVPRP